MEWHSLSSDLHPIEHVLEALGRRLRTVRNTPQTLLEPDTALVGELRHVFDAVSNDRQKLRRTIIALWPG